MTDETTVAFKRSIGRVKRETLEKFEIISLRDSERKREREGGCRESHNDSCAFDQTTMFRAGVN